MGWARSAGETGETLPQADRAQIVERDEQHEAEQQRQPRPEGPFLHLRLDRAAAHAAIVAEKRAAGAERVERKLAEVNLPSDVRDRRVGRATEYAEQRDSAEIVHA